MSSATKLMTLLERLRHKKFRAFEKSMKSNWERC